MGSKEDPWFPGDGFGARKLKSGPAATAAPPGARPGAIVGAADNPQAAIEGA